MKATFQARFYDFFVEKAYISKFLFYKMWRLLLFIVSVHSFDHRDCSARHGSGDRMCAYMRKFNKKYTPVEFALRKENVLKRVHHVQKTDAKTSFGLTTVSDRTEEVSELDPYFPLDEYFPRFRCLFPPFFFLIRISPLVRKRFGGSPKFFTFVFAILIRGERRR